MKKTLLLLSALLVAASSMLSHAELKSASRAVKPTLQNGPFQVMQAQPADRAGDFFKAPQRVGEPGTIGFHYWSSEAIGPKGESYWTALRIPQQRKDSLIWQMIELPQSTLQTFAGNKITGMTIYTGCNAAQTANNITKVTLALTNDLEEEPFYEQAATLTSSKFKAKTINFTEPIEIDPTKPLYAGYYFKLTSAQLSSYYIPIDGVPTNNIEGCWVRYTDRDENTGDPTGYVWNNLAQDYGSLMISLNIAGDNLPQNQAQAAGLVTEYYSTVGKDMMFGVNLTNMAANDITNVEVEYSVNNGELQRTTVELAAPVAYGAQGMAVVKTLCPTASVNLPVRARITKVNVADNIFGETWVQSSVLAVNEGEGFQRNVLLEEGTGTWCGWCPLGYLALEEAAVDYTDGTMVLAALHKNDDMANPASETIIQNYFSGFPQCVFNRQQLMGFQQSTAVNKANISDLYNLFRGIPGVAKIDLQLVESATPGKITANTVTEFILPSELGYRVGFEMIEDGVGPYEQTNYLKGTPGFGVFSANQDKVSVMYNDVVRNVVSPFGVEGSLPASVQPGQKYAFSTELDLSCFKKTSNARIAAFVINTTDGSIENVTVMKVADAAGVDDNVIDSRVRIQPMPGAISVSGAERTEVYTISGTRAAFARGEATIALPAGLYIVKAGDKVQKVVVR